MQLRLPWTERRSNDRERAIEIGGRRFPVQIFRRRGARRYVVRVTPDAVVRLTVPYGAAITDGLSFAERQAPWIAAEWQRQAARQAPWTDGTPCWFRGARVAVRLEGGRIRLGDEDAGPHLEGIDVRETLVTWLRAVATSELPARCVAMAQSAGIDVSMVSVRNQRSRWGACSSRGSITLNWRLVQVPESVRDYVIWHELAHRAVPNHSRRFWREVERLYPPWQRDERWLKTHEHEFF